MKIHIIGDPEHVPARFHTSINVSPGMLRDTRYMLYYHDECDGIIVTTPDAMRIIDRARVCKTTPLLAIGQGLLSCAAIPGPASDTPETIVLRTGSRPQEWFDGAETIERKLAVTIDGTHAATHRLPISGITAQQHGAIYDPEDHPFLVGTGWYPATDDPIWLAFIDAIRSNYV